MAEMINMANGKNVDSFYILMRDRTAKKLHNGYSSSSSKILNLLEGAILIRNVTSAVDERNGSIRLHPYDKPSYFCDCPLGEVIHIDEEQAKLLLPISTMRDRLNLFINKSRIKNGKKMTVGSYVYAKVRSGASSKHELRGIVRYKGPLPDEYGTWFGVELLEGTGTGKGTTNGLFRGKRFFKCQNDFGIFVSLEKLRLCEDQTETKSESKTDTKEVNGTDDSGVLNKVKKIAQGLSNFMTGEQPHGNSLDMQKKSSECASYGGHKVDDRVWVYISQKCDKPSGGYIRYIGRLPAEKGISVGIELDHAYGQGNGEYHNKQLFTCKMNHAHFTPIDNVISIDKLQELFEQPEGVNVPDLKNKPPSQPQTSEDILGMESRFSNQSEDQIRKEQEKMLKKFQEDKQKMAGTQDFQKNGVEHTELDERWKNKNGNQPNANRHVFCTTVDVNKHVKDPRNPTSLPSKLDIGSMVQVLSKHQTPKYGVIRWIGFIPNSDKTIAGLELEEELNACTDGTFLGKRYFTCPNRRGFFVHLHNCQPDSRFDRNSMEYNANKRLTGTDFGNYHSPITEDHQLIEPATTLDVYLKQKPQGIQGHHNSCYLDATLFAIFAFSYVMDSILLRPKNEKDIDEYDKVQTVLRNKIVYPLRSNGFVRADRVLELRELLDKLGTVTGLVGEEKDPEEFLTTLLHQVLKSEPFLKIKQGKSDVSNEYFYQVLADKDVERVLPSVEELLKKSFHQSDLKLTEVPSCLIVQMPRFGKGFKMYNRILPSLKINIGELVEDFPQDCTVCGRLARYHCRECFAVTGTDIDSSGNLCRECNERVHSHVKRNKHEYKPIAVSRDITRNYSNKTVEHHEMELFAVICIETSHYVTFAKCEEPNGEVKWCFFDSMADRIGTKNGYNVPSVTECPEIIEWLSSEKQNRDRIINAEDKEMPDRVRRILGDAYVCLYESKEMAMYK